MTRKGKTEKKYNRVVRKQRGFLREYGVVP